MASQRRRLAQKGVSLVVGTASMILLIPSAGLAIDAALLYYTKARLQGAVDGAALGAARALSLGSTTAAQAANAKQNAVNWFYANFPSTLWGTSNTQMDQSTVTVADDPNNPHLQTVTVTANTTVPTIFMRWFNMTSTVVAALGTASRRDLVVMMVLDRSSSMNVTGSCPDLIAAGKIFTGQFAVGRDSIGLVSFSDGTYVHSTPTTNFQSVLGYNNGSSSGTGELDNIVCLGGTNTSSAISVAYNELYKVNQPGAFNVLLLETDGLPNSMALNWWDSVNSKTGLQGSGCLDTSSPNKTVSGGGWTTAGVQRAWTPGHSMNTGGTGYMADIPAGPIGALYSQDPGGSNAFMALANPWHTSSNMGINGSGATDSSLSSAATNGCAFNANSATVTDFAWMPMTDVYGNSLNPATNPYLTVNTYSTGGQTRLQFSTAANKWQNYHNASLNAADNAAYRARSNATLPVTIFVIGLGGNTSYVPDYTLLQRIANDPTADAFNSPQLYTTCATTTGCVNYPSQPQGTFIWSVDKNELRSAFLKLSSQILRLSK